MNAKGFFSNRNFLALWSGQTVSMFGSQVTLIALPLVAAWYLDANPLQMSVIGAMGYVPSLLMGLVVGVWVEKANLKLVLVLSDLARAMALAAVPITFLMHDLHFVVLYLVSFLVGLGTIFSDVAAMSYIPTVVSEATLVRANSRLETSNSLASLFGQALGGTLVEAVGAPFSIIVDAISFLFSAVAMFFVRAVRRAVPTPSNSGESMWRSVKTGLVLVLRNPILRAILVSGTLFNMFTIMMEPVFLLYVARTLHLSAIWIGIIFSFSGVGALIGSLIAERFSKAYGSGYALAFSLVVAGLVSLLVPLSVILPRFAAIIALIVMQLVDSSMLIAFNINQKTLRTLITPSEMLSRMNGTIRFFIYGVVPIGELLGGVLGNLLGILPTLIIGAIGLIASSGVLLSSPILGVRDPTESRAREGSE